MDDDPELIDKLEELSGAAKVRELMEEMHLDEGEDDVERARAAR